MFSHFSRGRDETANEGLFHDVSKYAKYIHVYPCFQANEADIDLYFQDVSNLLHPNDVIGPAMEAAGCRQSRVLHMCLKGYGTSMATGSSWFPVGPKKNTHTHTRKGEDPKTRSTRRTLPPCPASLNHKQVLSGGWDPLNKNPLNQTQKVPSEPFLGEGLKQ